MIGCPISIPELRTFRKALHIYFKSSLEKTMYRRIVRHFNSLLPLMKQINFLRHLIAFADAMCNHPLISNMASLPS